MGSDGEVGGVELLSKRVGRERGKTTHTPTHIHTREGGGQGGRRERKGEERKNKRGGGEEGNEAGKNELKMMQE